MSDTTKHREAAAAGLVTVASDPVPTIVGGPTADGVVTGPGTGWRAEFERRAGAHRDVSVGPITLAPAAVAALGPSLATFQIGESGSGEHLMAAADAADVDADHRRALELFVVEEQEHARLLGLILDALDRPRRRSHWSDRVFVLIRRSRSLRAEVLTLLVAEVIALRYYAALRDRNLHPALTEVFARIHADEVRHVAFHGDTLPAHLNRFGPVGRRLARLAWNTVVGGAALVVALDHGAALRLAGVGRVRFVVDVWAIRGALDRRLFRSGPTPERSRPAQ